MSAVIASPVLSTPPLPLSHEPFANLFTALEDLLRRIADTDDPDLRRKRAQVRRALLDLQSHMPVMTLDAASTKPEPDWEQSALAALAGVAFALSVFQED
jgi:hypothetical protein